MELRRTPVSSAMFGWESLLCTDVPEGCSLKAALFTTYDRADERLIVEHLLPVLLKLSREPEGEGVERQYFLLELDLRLKQLHDRILVVSSAAREEPGDGEECESGTYGWIWRFIRHATVGRQRKAVQHAKLWLLHWGAADADGTEYLEIVVSSTNLTRAAFKGQLQAAWRVCLELRPSRSGVRLLNWGVLPDFLRELAKSADETEHMAPFVELLARADCPVGITFVASVPGTHPRQELRHTPWGAAGLHQIAPPGRGKVSASVLCPFVGSWNEGTLTRWCTKFEGSPDRLQLVWIDKDHPWARAWILPKVTLRALKKAGATLLLLRHAGDGNRDAGLFHEEQHPADDRWSHAKLYSLKRGTSHRLLVTSANFSPAAWGNENKNGELIIENFELGVCIEQGAWPFDLDAFPSVNSAATVWQLPAHSAPPVAWARAAWNGKVVSVSCRCMATVTLHGQIISTGKCVRVANWTTSPNGQLRSARVAWTEARRPPSWVRLTCEGKTMSVAIFDERPSRERENAVPPEVDKDVCQTMRDELLFEQYGGRVATEDEEALNGTVDAPGNPDEQQAEGVGGRRPDSYAVPAFVLGRRHLQVVDNWAEQVKCTANRSTNEFERKALRRDGGQLIEAFKRQAVRERKNGIGATLAAEELTIRLKHFPEA